jgi:hypothetical protein
MPVFISYSFENKAEFDNIADALEQKGIAYWKTGALKAGAPLGDQLRQAIVEAELCVFVATRHSIASSWCGAELGAFWGAGKRVVIYVSEASLSEDEMPKQFKGHLVERRISRVVEAVQAYLAETKKAEPEKSGGSAADGLPTVGTMSVEELKSLVAEAVNRIQDASFVATTLTDVARLLRTTTVTENSPEHRQLRDLLTDLLGVRGTVVRDAATRVTDWQHKFTLATETGDWNCVALVMESPQQSAVVDFYRNCLAWRVERDQRVEAVAIIPKVTDHAVQGFVGAEPPLLVVGRGAFGSLKR